MFTNKNYNKFIVFIITTSSFFLILSKKQVTYSDTLIFLLCLVCGYLFYENRKRNDTLIKANSKNETVAALLHQFNNTIDNKFKSVETKIETLHSKSKSQAMSEFPAMNISLISAFDKNETYLLDNKLDETVNSNANKQVLKKLSTLLKKNGQNLKTLKPFNQEVFSKISAGSASDNDEDILNINFPTNLINSN